MNGPFEHYASVILDLAIDKTLDYGIPQTLNNHIRRGMRVEVPLKGTFKTGYVVDVKSVSDWKNVKPIARALSETELIEDELFDLALWMSKYYAAPLRQVLKMILPSPVRKDLQHKQQLFVMRAKTREEMQQHCVEIRGKFPAQAEVLDFMLMAKKGVLLSELLEETKLSRSPVDTLAKQGWLVLDIVRVDRSPLINEQYFMTKAKILNEEQAEALHHIVASLQAQKFETHLLHGVTGSGKTEVYLQAIEEALRQDKGTIMLVPEISLTAQTIERFRSRFEGKIAILHHRLSQGERFDEWHKIRRNEAQIVIGARSAIFSPVQNLGLIIVDEEHESSYKQSEEVPCYHARDVAVMRGMKQKATVILGSATPSLESYYNATQGKYRLSTLTNRANAASIPKFTIVEMRNEYAKAKCYTNFSEALIDGIKKRQELGEQTILFLNRRGYHTTLFCKECGKVIKCNDCDVSLTFHLGENHLACHLCGYTLSPPPIRCPFCQKDHPIKHRGVGTEQIEKALHAILPDIRTLRVDADTTKHKGSHQKLLRQFGSGKADVLIGTQMIAKGLHFPQVTLVGVLNSDSSLNIPDFRASETVFQLITQVAGRAGRGTLQGEVIIQTCLPENNTIQLAASQNYLKFYEEEIEVRKLFGYPPFASLVKLAFSGPDDRKTKETAEEIKKLLIENLPTQYELYPVTPSGHAKVKGKFRYQVLVRGPSIYSVTTAIENIKNLYPFSKEIRVLVDVNPLSTFF